MKTCLIGTALSLLLAGCSPTMDAQSALLMQARRGIAFAQANHVGCASVHEQYAKLRRARLDDAFDADVRSRDQLTAQWVIDHRTAYAAALDAQAKQRHELEESHRVSQQNLQAVDAALERAQWLGWIQHRYWNLLQREESK